MSLRPLLFAMAALGMLAMPIEYRAGAEAPHYHVFFQLWIDASNASFRHHEPASHHANVHRPSTAPVSSDGTSAAGDPDAPHLSAMTAPETRRAIMSPLAGLLLAIVAGLKARLALAPRPPTGRLPGPEPPPPRLAG